MRSLFVCPEKLRSGSPAGIGIRFLELAKAATDGGIEVVLASPDGAPDGPWRPVVSSAENLDVESRRSDSIYTQGHAVNDVLEHGSTQPLVIDLYDPYFIENLHYAEAHPDAFSHDYETILRSLRRGDFFLCASETQKMFYTGMLSATGRINPERFNGSPRLDNLLAIVPFGVPRPVELQRERSGEHRVLFGSVYDWYRPELAIEAVMRANRRGASTKLTFLENPNPDAPRQRFEEARSVVRKSGAEAVIDFLPWVRYEERSALYASHQLALLTFDRSLETDLSYRTRILDYLWGGLPVVSSSAPETDAILTRFGAGVSVPSNDPDDLAGVLIDILNSPSEMERLRAGARDFVREYQWPALAEPLLRFLRKPAVDRTKRIASAFPDMRIPLTVGQRVRRKLRSIL
ncbi:MAG: glycosyltransferase family 4 protein [Acidobacteria bacterium]|nr:glycosyltransferase family 4 protein [Acidobacteriota bacterium]